MLSVLVIEMGICLSFREQPEPVEVSKQHAYLVIHAIFNEVPGKSMPAPGRLPGGAGQAWPRPFLNTTNEWARKTQDWCGVNTLEAPATGR